MAAVNQRISELREIVGSINFFPTTYNYIDPALLELNTLLMVSQKFTGGPGGRRIRDISTRLTYGEVYKILLNLLLNNVGKVQPYVFSGKFNFATYGVNIYCKNATSTDTPQGRQVISYRDCKNWFDNQSGYAANLKQVGYNGDHTNDKYDPNP